MIMLRGHCRLLFVYSYICVRAYDICVHAHVRMYTCQVRRRLPKFGGGAKYITWTYLYEKNLQSYGVIVKVGGAIVPSAPLAQPPLLVQQTRSQDQPY